NDLQEAREIAEIYEEIHESETGVFGLGKTKNERKAARQEKKADRKEAKADKKAIKEKAKEEKKAIKDKYKGKEKRENLKKVRQEKRDEMKDFREETGRGLVRNIVRYNPATILLRNGILAAMKLNMFRLAKVAKWGYLSEVAAKEKGLNLIEYQKSVKLLQKLENVFKDVGGKLENLKTAIIKGGKGEGLKGLGVEPVTAAAALTAAAGTLAAVKLFAKQLGIDSDNFGKNLFPNDKGAAADEDSIDEGDPSGLPTGDWSSEGFDSEEERDIISRNTNADDDEKKNSMWLWIGLGAAGLVTLAAVSGVFKGKKTNKK
ncbi:MAG: hypothetical protein KKD31_14605, partial [Bacteroidetes bacterium]|nr:hypothetical protein [Bacteroidota bacterium]